MSAGLAPITAEELMAMPEDGVDRWIIRGELREAEMSFRGVLHTETTSNVDFSLRLWLRTQPRPRGKVLVGDAGVRLRQEPDNESTVGIDLLYLSPELAAQMPSTPKIIEIVPTLAIEILSPSDRQEDVEEKIDLFLEMGVLQVWSINPKRRTVTVYRSDRKPMLFNDSQELNGEPELPGFMVPVLSFFEDIDP